MSNDLHIILLIHQTDTEHLQKIQAAVRKFYNNDGEILLDSGNLVTRRNSRTDWNSDSLLGNDNDFYIYLQRRILMKNCDFHN